MSRREEFKTRMKEFKQYKDTTGKGYWEWKQYSKELLQQNNAHNDVQEIPSYEKGGSDEDARVSITTNAVRKALEDGNVQLAQKILRSGKRDNKEFYYPDNGSIRSLFNIYDTPLLGDALSLLDALKYSVKGDWDNASLSYMDAASPLALFSRSKLNWKGWGAKKKYIPEYEAIEREAKKNGTWLKNTDGTDFTGDPREWVVKRSKKFREAFGDKYLEGYTGMRSPYNPRELLDTYLSSRERAYTYTPNKNQIKKKGDTGIAKLVVPDTDIYTVDALGNDWLHLTDKSINPYNFTNTNQIVSSIQTPVISFKNIRDDGPFGMRDIAEDQFVAKSTTPRKSVLYNNGDFDLSNHDIFKTTIAPYIGYKIYNKANRENTQSYAIGGETDQPDIYTDERTDHPIAVRQNLDRNINVANYIDRINHIDPNIGEYNPFYTASDDTYGTVSIPEVTVTAPWTKRGRNNADARRGMHYVQQGLEDAAKVAAPIIAGAALPAMASTGALSTITDLASMVTNPLDPTNYLDKVGKVYDGLRWLNTQYKLRKKIGTWDRVNEVQSANIGDLLTDEGSVQDVYLSTDGKRVMKFPANLGSKTEEDLRRRVKEYLKQNSIPNFQTVLLEGYLEGANNVKYPIFSQKKLQTLGQDFYSSNMFDKWNDISKMLDNQMCLSRFKGTAETGYRKGRRYVGDIHPGNIGFTDKGYIRLIDANIEGFKEGGEVENKDNNDQGWLSRLINSLVNPMPFIYSNPTQTLFAKSIEEDKQRDDIRYNRVASLSKSIYETIRASQGDPAALPIEATLSVDPIPIEPDIFDPGRAFFLTKDDQERFFENNGYRTIGDVNIQDEDIFKRQFGTVRGAAKQYLDNGYQIPIYEYTADSDTTVSDNDMTPIGNFYSLSGYIKPKKYISTTDIAFLPHSGNHSNTVYLHNDGKLYVRSWDLNDYGTGSSGSGGAASTYGNIKKRAANLLDISGNPFIQRTGYVPLLYKEQYDELPEKVKQNIPSTAIQYLKPIPDDLNYKKVVEKAKQKRSKQRNK